MHALSSSLFPLSASTLPGPALQGAEDPQISGLFAALIVNGEATPNAAAKLDAISLSAKAAPATGNTGKETGKLLPGLLPDALHDPEPAPGHGPAAAPDPDTDITQEAGPAEIALAQLPVAHAAIPTLAVAPAPSETKASEGAGTATSHPAARQASPAAPASAEVAGPDTARTGPASEKAGKPAQPAAEASTNAAAPRPVRTPEQRIAQVVKPAAANPHTAEAQAAATSAQIAAASLPTTIHLRGRSESFAAQAGTPRTAPMRDSKIGPAREGVSARDVPAAPRPVLALSGADPQLSGSSTTPLANGEPQASRTVLAPQPSMPGPIGETIAIDPRAPLQTVAAAPAATGSAPTSAPAPQDFATLVDRLVEAREAASPHLVRSAVSHAEFGQVSLQFRIGEGSLAVTMASADPDFAPAVQAAAASAQGGAMQQDQASGQNAGTPRHDPQAQGQAPASSGGQDRPAGQQTGQGQPQTFARDDARTRGGNTDQQPAAAETRGFRPNAGTTDNRAIYA